MTVAHAEPDRAYFRDTDRAWLGGVCAGLARYFGFNLKVTRLLVFIAFLMTGPVVVIAYVAAVCLTSARSELTSSVSSGFCRARRCGGRKKTERSPETGPSAADMVRSRCEDMDKRLARLEKHVTSRRFQIEQELSRL